MSVRIEEDHPSIVVLGGFDPSLFQPQWLRAEKLLGETEAKNAEVKMIHPDVTEWSTDWLLVQVLRNRLFVQGKTAASAEQVRDLVVGILSILEHTVITTIGLNRSMHFDVGGESSWHAVGHRLAPKDLWTPHMSNKPGMRTLQVEEDTNRSGCKGKTIVTVQPSSKVTHGVFFDVNNEMQTTAPMPLIREHWTPLLESALGMAEAILQGARTP